jgi:DNA-binding XRE family transcriptional regulator
VIDVIEAGPRGGIDKDRVIMGEIQKLTIDGKGYVLLSEDDYEDLIDTIAAERIMARIAAGEETWPLELVMELSETDSRIRTFRTYRKLSVSDLAAAAGISQPYLSEIESGKKTGSVEVLKRIAAALKVDLDDIVV